MNTLNEIETFISQQRTANTRLAYRQDLEAWVKFLGSREATESIVVEWRDLMATKLSNATCIRRYNTVRTFYKWSGGPNPFERVKAPVRVSGWAPHIPSDEDVTALLSQAKTPREKTVLSLLSNGLRAQEVCDLSQSDFFYEPEYRAHILRVMGKGGKIRLVPANSEVVEALAETTLPIDGLNIRKVYHIVQKVAKRAGVKGIYPHALRHQYATRLVRAQVPVFSLQRLLGHSRADTTGVYVNLDIGDLVRASIADPRNRRPVNQLNSGDRRQ